MTDTEKIVQEAVDGTADRLKQSGAEDVRVVVIVSTKGEYPGTVTMSLSSTLESHMKIALILLDAIKKLRGQPE